MKRAFLVICISKAPQSSPSNFKLFQDGSSVNKKNKKTLPGASKESRGKRKQGKKKEAIYIYIYILRCAVKNARQINKTDTLLHCQWHSGVI